MKKILIHLAFLCAFLSSSGFAQTVIQGDRYFVPGAGNATEVANCSPTGTSLNTLAKIVGNCATVATTADTSGITGVVKAGAGTSGLAAISEGEQAFLYFDGATTAGDIIQISGSTGGYGHDTGSALCPGTGQVIGRVLSTNASSGLYLAMVGTQGCGSGGGSGIVPANLGGTGINSIASAGVPLELTTGVWSINPYLPSALGGLGANFGSATGIVQFNSGVASVSTTVPVANVTGNFSVGGNLNLSGLSTGCAYISAGVLTSTGSGCGGSGGSPAGSTGQLQTNLLGAFGAPITNPAIGSPLVSTNSTSAPQFATGITYVTTSQNWSQSLSTSLTPCTTGISCVTQTVTLPSGIAGIDVTTGQYFVYINDSNPEAVLVTGGTYTYSGGGTITFVPYYAHTSYTIGSASSGIQETINYACGTSATVYNNGSCRVTLPANGTHSNLNIAYAVYGTIYTHSYNGFYDGNGALLRVYNVRGPVFWLTPRLTGSLKNANNTSGNTLTGFVFSAVNTYGPSALNMPAFYGDAVTNTAMSSGTATITTASAHGFHPGDLVTIQFTDNSAYWGDCLIATVPSTTTFTCGKASGSTISSQATPGVVALEFTAILDNAASTKLDNIQQDFVSSEPGFNNIFDFWDDENATIEHFNNGGNGLNTNVNWSPSYIASYGNPISGQGQWAPVITVNDSTITAQGAVCATVLNSNGFYFNNSICQSAGAEEFRIENTTGNYQGGQFLNLYDNGGCDNPASPVLTPWAGMGCAGLLAGESTAGASFSIHGGGGAYGQFATGGTGSTPYTYYEVCHDSTAGWYTSPIQILNWESTGSDSIPVKFPRCANGTDTITYDIIRMTTPTFNGSVPPAYNANPYPSNGNCTGGSGGACGSVATAISQSTACSGGLVCSYTDTGSSTTSSYTIHLGNWQGAINFAPGALVVVGQGTVSTPVDVDTEQTPPQGVGLGGNPIQVAKRCNDNGAWASAGGYDVCMTAIASNGVPNQAGWILADGFPGQGLAPSKGRLNFGPTATNLYPHHIITLLDSQPTLTLATPNLRPPANANDTWIGTDVSSGTALTAGQLAFGAPVAITNYIASTGSTGSGWKNRQTSSLFEVATAAQFDSTVTFLSAANGCAQFTSGVISSTGTSCGGTGIPYPSGTGIVAISGGTAWGSTYNASNTIPSNFLPSTVAYLNAAQTFSAVQTINPTGTAFSTLPSNANLVMGNSGAASRLANLSFGGAGYFSGVAFGGTAASPTAVASATELGGFNAWAYNGTGLNGPVGAFRVYANQAQTTSNGGTYADIAVTPNGSTTEAEVIKFENDGGIDVPGATGGDQGPGTGNFTGLFINGVAVGTSGGITSTLPISGTTTIQYTGSLCNSGSHPCTSGGVTDNSAAFTAACAAYSIVYVPAGNYAITSNYTITCPVEFGPGASLVAPTSVTITLDYCPISPPTQIFTTSGSGVITYAKSGCTASNPAYPEWWAATGSSGSPTDQTPINSCLAGGGFCQLGGKTYYTNASITPISGSTLNGLQNPVTAIYYNQATGDIVALTTDIYVTISNLTLKRTVAGSVGASGVSMSGAAEWNKLQRLNIADSPNGIYVNGITSGGGGNLARDVTVTYSSTSSTSVTQYGVNQNGPCNSGLMDNVVVISLDGSLTTYGLYLHGSGIHDCSYNEFQTASTIYGIYIDGTGSTTGTAAADIHFSHPILDSCGTSCFYTTGLASTGGAMAEVDGAWFYGGYPSITLLNSSGVNIQGAQVRWIAGGSDPNGAIYISGGGGNSIRGMTAYSDAGTASTFMVLSGTTDNTISGNSIIGISGNTNNLINLVSGSLRNVVSNNALSGYATLGIYADSTSNNNLNYPNSIDTTNITTAYTDAGTGNQWNAVYNVATGSGLTGGPCTGSCTISIASGGVTNAMLANSAITIAGTSVSLGGSTSSFPSPGAIGGTTPAAGSFTTLSASGTVSGSGFSTYLASPPAIGGTAAAAGSFTTLNASSTVGGAGFEGFCQPGSFASQTDAATVTWAIGSAPCANAKLLFTVHSGSRTLNLTGLVNGGSYVITIQQDSTGGEGLTLGTGCTWQVSQASGGWLSGGTVAPSTSANAYNVLAFTYDGTNCFLNFH